MVSSLILLRSLHEYILKQYLHHTVLTSYRFCNVWSGVGAKHWPT